jgi:proteasome accessory factor A
LLEAFIEAERLEWTDPWLSSLDLEYHNIDADDGLYHQLARARRVRRMIEDDRIARAIHQPPADTRAYFRGECVRRFGTEIQAVQWDEISLCGESGTRVVSMMDLFDDAAVRRYNAAVDEAVDVAGLLRRLEDQSDGREQG